MSGFMLFILLFTSIRLYARWLGYYRLITHGVQGTAFDVPRDWNWRPRVTFMVPTYNEGQVVCDSVESIMASKWPKELMEIVMVDDGSQDDTWLWLQKMRDKYPDNVVIWQNNPNVGKAITLTDMIERSTGEILFTIDSDTVVHPETIEKIVSCYADPDIAGVGGFVLCKNLNDSMWTRMQGMNFVNYYYFTKTFENQFRAARVVNGQIASFRKTVLEECIPMIRNREVFGLKNVRYGDDSYITAIICMGHGLSKRWKVYNNFEAFAWTNNPATFMGYLRQQLRWWRSQTWGYMTIVHLWTNLKRAGILPIMATTFTVLSILGMFSMLLFFISIGYFCQMLVMILLVSSVAGALAALNYNWMIGQHDKIAGKIQYPIFVGIWFGLWMIICWLALSIIATLTLDDIGWVTRQGTQSNIGQK